MIRLSTAFWLVLVSVTGFGMFGIKYAVQTLEDELNRIKKATIAEEHAIRTNEAEWAYLTRPETLDELNRHYLSLGPIATKQLHASFTDIPLRPQTPLPVDPPTALEPAGETGELTPAPPVAADAPVAAPPVAAAPVAAAAPEKPPRSPEPAKVAPVKTAAKPVTPPRRARSLDELIAQVAASR